MTIAAVLRGKGSNVETITADVRLFDAVRRLGEKRIGALVVVENDRIAGIMSERDYTRKVFLRGKKSKETRVDEIMSTSVMVTHPNESVDECLRVMTDKHVRHLPVLDGEQVVGVISIGDLVKHIISCQSATIAHLESYISGGYTG